MTNELSMEGRLLATNLHRRPAFAVNAPVITRHVGFRLTDSENPTSAATPAGHDERLNALIDAVNGYIARLNPDAAPQARFARYGEKATPNIIDRTQTLSVEIPNTSGYRLRVRTDIHDEYFTLTFVADSFNANGSTTAGATMLAALKKLEHADLPREMQGGSQSSDVLSTFVFDNIWEAIELEHELRWRGHGELFADFRGFAICPPLISQPLSERKHKNIQIPLQQMRELRKARQIDDALLQFIDERKNFLAAAFSFGSDPLESIGKEDANVVLCGMLDGAAIYGSALGKTSDSGRPSVRYFLVYNGYSSTQLGRLMRRLHVLGEARTAALLDIEGLRAASRAIRTLGFDVDDFTISAIGPNEKDEVVEANFSKIVKTLTTIGKERDDPPQKGCVGGLVYRVNRSRLYSETYRSRLQDLRIVRIEGWQPYDEFVRRTLFKDFDYVNFIGDRYAALRRRIEQLNSLLLTRRLEQYSASVDRTSKLLHQAADASVELAAATNGLIKTSVELGVFAEVIGGGAFVYYIGSMLFHVSGLFVRLPDDNEAFRYLIAFLVSMGFYVFLRGVVFKRLEQSKRRDLRTLDPQSHPPLTRDPA